MLADKWPPACAFRYPHDVDTGYLLFAEICI